MLKRARASLQRCVWIVWSETWKKTQAEDLHWKRQ